MGEFGITLNSAKGRDKPESSKMNACMDIGWFASPVDHSSGGVMENKASTRYAVRV